MKNLLRNSFWILGVLPMLLSCSTRFEALPFEKRTNEFQFSGKPYSEFLAQMPCESNEIYNEYRYHTNDGCSLYIRELGNVNGPPIVFLHGGWGADLELMYNVFRYFKNDYHLIFYDQRGSLRSPCNNIKTVTVENHVQDLELIRDRLKLDSFTIIAHSMGSYLAMKYFETYETQNIDKAIFLGGLPVKHSLWDMTMGQQSAMERTARSDVLNLARDYGADTIDLVKRQAIMNLPVRDRFVVSNIASAAINLHDVSRFPYLKGEINFQHRAGQTAAQSMEQSFRCRILGQLCQFIDLRYFSSWDFRKTIAKGNANVYFIHGDDDFISLEDHFRALQNAPNTRLKVITNAGHVPWIDQPEVITDLLPELLN